MRDLREYVADYVLELSGPNSENAWHSLVEAGPAALPHLIQAFERTGDRDLRATLIEVVAEWRSAEGVPFLAALLRDSNAEIWKRALDGLVAAGSAAALKALYSAKVQSAPGSGNGSTKQSSRLSMRKGLANRPRQPASGDRCMR